tara:strand:- start:5084 stop:5602 length:519 start_codon:yes stop_codon:yes gene_type:complete
MKESAAVAIYSGMNPPNSGHDILVTKLFASANRHNAQPIIYLSHIDDASNKLSFNERVNLAETSYGRIVVKSSARNITEMIAELSEYYNKVIVVDNSERVLETSKLCKMFKNLVVEDSNTRDPDTFKLLRLNAASRKHRRGLKREALELQEKEKTEKEKAEKAKKEKQKVQE